MVRAAVILLVVGAGVWLGGCGGSAGGVGGVGLGGKAEARGVVDSGGVAAGDGVDSEVDSDVGRMMDRGLSLHLRLEAARRAEAVLGGDARRLAGLRELVWGEGHPDTLGVFAVDSLVRWNEGAARGYLGRSILLIDDAVVLGHVLDVAVERGWVEMVPAVVRSYESVEGARVRPVVNGPVLGDGERLERAVIAALVPGRTVEETVLGVFGGEYGAEARERVAAWALLYRLVGDGERMMEMLEGLSGGDVLVERLKMAWRELGVLPSSVNGVAWVLSRYEPERRGFLREAIALVGGLGDEGREGLELRHLGPLVYLLRVDAGVLGESRAGLVGGVVSSLSGRVGYAATVREGAVGEARVDSAEVSVGERVAGLGWADVATVLAVDRVIREPSVVAALFRQGDVDVADERSERGGLLRVDWESGRVEAAAYEPMMRGNDLAYVPGESIVTDGYTAVAHYHFHAQSYENGEWAGPGAGDMERISGVQGFKGVVLTFIDRDTLNADVYFGGDTIIDLGMLSR